jgi:ABC-type glycerol-3-phosphate transport system substrate-binding protein
MKDNFQIILVVVFIAFAIFGVLVFSGAIPIGGDDANTGKGSVTMWGTVKGSVMAPLLEDFNTENTSYVLRYVEKSPDTFDQNLLEALASGQGPDMFLLTDNLAVHYANKIVTIPYQSYPVANFKTNFAGAADVFLSSKGILAFPLLIDPLVMYYNRSILDAIGIVTPPTSWSDFKTISQKLTVKDESNKILKSGAALGHYSNVVHAKNILATLFMQAGNPIVTEKNGLLTSVLYDVTANFDLYSVLQFYVDFADPLKSTYSWNKSFPNSSDAFSAEDLAFYFGYASELSSFINQNPNQNFSIAPIPQIKGASFKLTGARVVGVAISSFSKNFNTAFLAAGQMASGTFAHKLAQALGVAPARRDLLAQKPNDMYSPVFYDSSLFARSWLDPSSSDTDDIFRGMIDGVLSNNLSTREAIIDASSRLGLLLNR